MRFFEDEDRCTNLSAYCFSVYVSLGYFETLLVGMIIIVIVL